MPDERDRIKAECERRLKLVHPGQVDLSLFEELFDEPYVIVAKSPKNTWF